MGEIKVMKEETSTSGGSVLKEKRQATGLSLETVHEATKIPLDVLRAIEEGYTVRNLSSFYYKGFLKIYAGYLNVDLSEVIENYQAEKLPPYIPKEIEENPWRQFKEKVSKFLTRERRKKLLIPFKKQLLVSLAAVAVLFLLYKIIFSVKTRHKTPSLHVAQINTRKVKEHAAPAPVVVKIIEKKERPVEPQVNLSKEPAEPAAVVPVAASETKVQKNVTLTVRAKKNSWLTVKADGEILFQSTLRAGTAETWLANDKIEISGKNIGQLEFELNGKMIGTLGRSEARAKAVVVTKQGLSVTK